MNTIQIAVYDLSKLVSVIEAEPKVAWQAGVACVRAHAHSEGVETEIGWYTTANRAVYARGAYRCLPVIADR